MLIAGRRRGGFTFTECVVALGVLGIALTFVAQVGLSVLREKSRTVDRQAAQEIAANLMELARARPWEDLTPEWAAEQRLPEQYSERGWSLDVKVEKQEARPLVKRMTVAVRWQTGKGAALRPVELVGVFAARSAEAKGGKP